MTRFVRSLPLVSFIMLAASCAEPTATPPLSPNAAHPDLQGSAMLNPGVRSFARALALALGEESARSHLRDDLRDSPFDHHRLHLVSYLHGADGAALRVSIRRGMGITEDSLRMLEIQLQKLELVMPRAYDRAKWNGDSNLEVRGTAYTRAEQEAARSDGGPGYDLNGAEIVGGSAEGDRRLLFVRPAEKLFPTQPETIRARAPSQERLTVSTFSEERAAQRELGREEVALHRRTSTTTWPAPILRTTTGCDPEADPTCCPPTADQCNPPPDGGGVWPVASGGTSPDPQMTQYYCFSNLDSSNDVDRDNIRDDCEYALAAALSPTLNVSDGDRAPGRNPYWAVSRHPDRPYNIQIFYALSYYEDAGSDFSPFTGSYYSSHHGDSEFIILEVQNSYGSTWGVVGATLSAHWHSPYDATATYFYDDLEYPGSVPYPRIWASLDKHANYRSKEVCGYGPGGPFYAAWDTCGGSYTGTRVLVESDRNLGNFYHLPLLDRSPGTKRIDCTTALQFGHYGSECYWSADHFGGWSGYHGDETATGYKQMFEFYGL